MKEWRWRLLPAIAKATLRDLLKAFLCTGRTVWDDAMDGKER